MKRNTMSETIGNIDREFVEEALYVGKSKVISRKIWVKVCATAACIALVAAVGIGFFASRDHTVSLDNGDTLYFHKSNDVTKSEQDADVFARGLTADESNMLFKDLSVDGSVIFDGKTYNVLGVKPRVLGIEGHIGSIELYVSVSGVNIDDTPIVSGIQKTSEIKGVPVTAGYCIINNKYVRYYASFEMGDNTVYVENGGVVTDSEGLKEARNELASAIQALIDNGEIDLGQLTE